MRFTGSRDDIGRELGKVLGAAKGALTIPASGMVLLSGDDGVVKLASTDLDITIAAAFPAKVKGSGALMLPAKKLFDIVKSFPDGAAVDVIGLDNRYASVECGRAKVKVAGADPVGFPKMPEKGPGPNMVINPAVLSGLIERVLYAVGSEESSYALNGALLMLDGTSVQMAATDTHRMAYAVAEQTEQNTRGARVIVPRKALMELASLLKRTDSLVGFDEQMNHLVFFHPQWTLSSRRLSGDFPPVEKVMAIHGDHPVTVDRESLLDALRRVVYVHGQQKSVPRATLTVSGKTLTVTSAETVDGRVEEAITVNREDGVDTGGSMNARYPVDFLSSLESEEVTITFDVPKSGKPIKFQAPDVPGYSYMVMPLS